jgi:hypothetical protein
MSLNWQNKAFFLGIYTDDEKRYAPFQVHISWKKTKCVFFFENNLIIILENIHLFLIISVPLYSNMSLFFRRSIVCILVYTS